MDTIICALCNLIVKSLISLYGNVYVREYTPMLYRTILRSLVLCEACIIVCKPDSCLNFIIYVSVPCTLIYTYFAITLILIHLYFNSNTIKLNYAINDIISGCNSMTYKYKTCTYHNLCLISVWFKFYYASCLLVLYY